MKGTRPVKGDCAPYFMKYIDLVEGNDILNSFLSSMDDTMQFINSIPMDKWDYAYAEGKWTIKELMAHIIDTERIFMSRALRIARNDKAAQPGFNQDDFVKYANANARSLESLVEEFESIRKSNLTMYQSFSDEMWIRKGNVSNNDITVLSIAFLTLGHQIHHMNVIKDKYLR